MTDSSLAKQCARILADHWEMLHVPAMTVAYALDSEFLDTEQQEVEDFKSDCNEVAADMLGSQSLADEAMQQWQQVHNPLCSGVSEGEDQSKQRKAGMRSAQSGLLGRYCSCRDQFFLAI